MQLTKSLLHTTDTYIKKLRDAGVETVSDFLSLFPRDHEDKSDVVTKFSLLDIREKQAIECKIELLTSEMTRNKKLLIKAVIEDADGSYAEAVWFNQKQILTRYATGQRVLIYGKPKYEYGRLSFPSPDIEPISPKRQEIVPVYSDVNYVPGTWIREKMGYLKAYINELDALDPVPVEIRTTKKMRRYSDSVRSIHFPASLSDFEQAKSEIGYGELFAFQRIGVEKKHMLRDASAGLAPIIPLDTELMKELIAGLPFPLTNKQKIVLFQILKDMGESHAMARLLQGDVGTGKTVVALLAAIHAILVDRRNNNGNLQIAIMAPTEILARQHFSGNEAWLMKLGISSDLLVGSLTPRMKEDARERLRSGQTEIIFGTHALIQDSVRFARLGFVVVDEQHRFGVEQRKALEEYFSTMKPHRLNMSATPIPRTLALTVYGDQDVSVLDEYPVGRKPIHTRVVKETQREEIYRWITEEVNAGRQVYWISPLVEESETLDIANATSMQENLAAIFPDFSVGLIHGKMSGKDKDRIMQEFYENKIQILSATAVVEVGVNNPNATIICIEAAERFGLSQLHQFRGRVGRGDDQSYCYLFTTKEYKSDRLKAMEQTGDGFELAQIDLELRGPGEVYGVRQSGVPDFHFADLRDVNLISEIREDIEAWMKNNSKS